MKKLILIALLIFSSPSYAEWWPVASPDGFTTFYLDFDRIREVDGYVYFWHMVSLAKPAHNGIMSMKTYSQGDCKLFRTKPLNYYSYKEPMGGGDVNYTSEGENAEWLYPPPDSASEIILNTVCDPNERKKYYDRLLQIEKQLQMEKQKKD